MENLINRSGSGFGYGYGEGSGYGSGDGLKTINGQKVQLIDDVQTIIHSTKGAISNGVIVKTDLTFEPCFIAQFEDFFAHGKTARKAFEEAKSKAFDSLSEEERISLFKKEFPDFNKKYPNSSFFKWHKILTGSCKLGRELFVKENNIDLESTMTVNEFIELTSNTYGSTIIKKIKKQ